MEPSLDKIKMNHNGKRLLKNKGRFNNLPLFFLF